MIVLPETQFTRSAQDKLQRYRREARWWRLWRA